jgi:hypothetical protein
VTYTDWQDTYFTGCNYDHPAGNDQFISVCDPDTRDIELPYRRAREILASGRRLVSFESAIDFSRQGLEKYRLLESKQIAAAVQSAQPGKPLIVNRLDKPNTYYHLVPWVSEKGVVATTQVDARFGTFQSIHWQEEPKREMDLLLGSADVEAIGETILKRVAQKQIELPKMRGQLKLFPQESIITPVLVWQPCRESFSPHLPFYQYVQGGNIVYVRIDGEVFTKLTTGKGV